ncbi:hypothetical protein B0H13DRAFT_1868520 [Mycena leptocephala]|nr:hypothetical protein B0H13DRAFT_1868520 [Mycena leptocephala]
MEYEIREGWCGREGGGEGGGAAEDLEEGNGEGDTREVDLPFCGQLENIRDGLGFGTEFFGGGGGGHWEKLGDFWRWNCGGYPEFDEKLRKSFHHAGTQEFKMRRCRKMIRFRNEKGEVERMEICSQLQRLSCNNVTISSGVKRFTRNRKNKEREKSVVMQRYSVDPKNQDLLMLIVNLLVSSINVLAIEYDWVALTEHKLKEDSSPRALPGMIWNTTNRSSLFTPYYELELDVPVSRNEDVRGTVLLEFSAVKETRRDQGSIQCKTLYLIWSKDLRASALLSTYS